AEPPRYRVHPRLEEAEGVRFLVLELVPGSTLGQRLSHGRLPWREALTLCRQVVARSTTGRPSTALEGVRHPCRQRDEAARFPPRGPTSNLDNYRLIR